MSASVASFAAELGKKKQEKRLVEEDLRAWEEKINTDIVGRSTFTVLKVSKKSVGIDEKEVLIECEIVDKVGESMIALNDIQPTNLDIDESKTDNVLGVSGHKVNDIVYKEVVDSTKEGDIEEITFKITCHHLQTQLSADASEIETIEGDAIREMPSLKDFPYESVLDVKNNDPIQGDIDCTCAETGDLVTIKVKVSVCTELFILLCSVLSLLHNCIRYTVAILLHIF